MPSERTVGSVCSGVGGLDLGLHRAGWTPKWFCEVKEYRRRVLDRHWPGVQTYEDLTTLDPRDLEPVTLLAGGTPCTNLSNAGGRSGLDGVESRLFWDFIRIRNAIEPEWTLWENVEGAFSTNGGLDFASVLAAFVGADVAVPDGGWGRSGVVAGPWGGAVWRLLDAQHFGVPQRRRRVFVVGRLGAECPPSVLLEPAGRGGDPAPRRGKRPRVAAALTGGSSLPGISAPGRRREDDVNIVAALDTQGGGADENDASGGRLVETRPVSLQGDTAGTLTSRYQRGANRTADEGAFVLFGSSTGSEMDVVPTIGTDSRSGPMQNQNAAIVMPQTLSPGHNTDEHISVVAEDQAFALDQQCGSTSQAHSTNLMVPSVAATLKGNRGAGGGGVSPEETLLVEDDAANTVRSHPRPSSNSLGGVVSVGGDVAHSLTSEGFDASEDGTGRGTPIVTEGRNGDAGASQRASEVRRLTPTECERLMGWPDGWTLAFGPSLADAPSGVGRGNGVFSEEPQTFDWQVGGATDTSFKGGSRIWMEDKPGRARALTANKTLAVAVSENQRAEVRETPIARQLSSGGSKQGQGYPAVRVDGEEDEPAEGAVCAVDPKPDGQRYSACGDGVVAPVGTWIGRRISAVDAGEDPDAA